MNLMAVVVSITIVGAAFGTIAAVMYAVWREKHEPEEWYIPPEDASVTQPAGSSGTASAE